MWSLSLIPFWAASISKIRSRRRVSLTKLNWGLGQEGPNQYWIEDRGRNGNSVGRRLTSIGNTWRSSRSIWARRRLQGGADVRMRLLIRREERRGVHVIGELGAARREASGSGSVMAASSISPSTTDSLAPGWWLTDGSSRGQGSERNNKTGVVSFDCENSEEL